MCQEVIELAREAERVIARKEPIVELQRAKQDYEDAVRTLKAKNQAMKDAIRKLTEAREEKENSKVHLEPENVFFEAVENIENNKFLSARNASAAEQQCEQLKKQCAKLKAELAEVDAAKKVAESEERDKQPQIRSALSLYAHVSNTRWDYDSEDVKGFITRSDSQE
eukprot:Colp12_sorted_trinity150504_noHs@2589